ncbi:MULTISPECIES: UDP-glucose 4-epimerase GalE [unclassified Phaeobacter]|uniref:UDP-glucose 4-epimerase GalE n=1 Tax=unclassified Phaeobacter TaxID=2621772 RepID=UPI003A835EB6
MANGGTVLVTGGAGFIGSHTILALEEAGYRTIVYDNFSAGHEDVSFGTHTIEGCLSDREKLVSVMRDYRVTGVVHFAALIEAGVSVREPLAFFCNNLSGTISLLEAMKDAEVAKIVFSSTAAVYGNQQQNGLRYEALPRAPVAPYGSSNAMVEQVLEDCARAHGLQAIALRYFNVAGADPLGRSGERHDPETHLIPLVIKAALGRGGPIRVFGTDYPTADGTCIRDYVHVSDLADAHVAAFAMLVKGRMDGFRALNLGSGHGHSVHQIVRTVQNVSGSKVPFFDAARRPGDPAELVADPSAARRLLGWVACRSDIETIVHDAWEFFHA